eukprot:gene26587-32132_t
MSSGHLKKEEDGLDVNAMNMYWGRKQRSNMRPTKITPGCLEPPSPNSARRRHTVYELSTWRGYSNLERKGQKSTEAAKLDSEGKIVAEGYVGKPKGIYQVLAERGLYVKGMRDSESEADKIQKRLEGKALLDPNFDASATLDRCTDFATEIAALEDRLKSRGHLLLISPKCHPALAGCGIEYTWGKAKMTYRGEGKDDISQGLLIYREEGLQENATSCPIRCTSLAFGNSSEEKETIAVHINPWRHLLKA